jgi:outer membrane protein assembly factor BamA
MRISRPFSAVPLLFILFVAARGQDFPLHALRIEGANRYPAEALAKLTGLQVGQPVNPAHFNEGAQRLADSGFVAGAQFRYEPAEVNGAQGYALIYQITEVDQTSLVIFDVPGVSEADLWRILNERDPLIARRMPVTPGAEAYYLAAVADAAAAAGIPRPELAVDIEGDLGTGNTTLVIQPKNLPVVAAIRVEGASVLPADKAIAALGKVVLGQPITERRFRQYVYENVTPLYEEIGRLKVAYPKVEIAPGQAGATVTLHCAEGIEYRLGSITFQGEGVESATLTEVGKFPLGKLANWKRISEGLATVRDEFRRMGYLQARLAVSRQLDDATARADATVEITRGVQFLMGDLILPGLPPELEPKVRKRWKLAAGEPLDALYVNEFIKDAFAVLEGYSSVSQDFQARSGSNVMDVSVTFR